MYTHSEFVLSKPEIIKKFCHCQTQWRTTWNNLSVWIWPVGLSSFLSRPSTPSGTPDCRRARPRKECGDGSTPSVGLYPLTKWIKE